MQDTEEPTQAPMHADPAAPAEEPATRWCQAAAMSREAHLVGAELMVAQVVPVWARQLSVTRDAAADGLSELLQAFSDISGALNALSSALGSWPGLAASTSPGAVDQAAPDGSEVKQAAQALAAQLDAILVHFQFGDRISQTLDLVSSDMNRFTRWVAQNPHASHGDAAQWLANLECRYTSDQQRATHHGKGPVDRGSAVDFF